MSRELFLEEVRTHEMLTGNNQGKVFLAPSAGKNPKSKPAFVRKIWNCPAVPLTIISRDDRFSAENTMSDSSFAPIINRFKESLAGLQVGRAQPRLVENVMVESYGQLMPLKSVANIGCPDAQTLRIEPWDKENVAAIEKAFQMGDLGLNPQNQGDYLLVPIPPLTTERRESLAKLTQQLAEEARIALRQDRQSQITAIRKNSADSSEDEIKQQEQEIQKAVDAANAEIASLQKHKEQEILSL